MQAQQPRILVTGASGFIGQSLVEQISRRGFFVAAATRVAGSFPPGVEAYEIGDIHARTLWQQALEDADVVIHLAARVHVMRDTDVDPLEAFRQVNLHGTVNLAKQAAAADVKRFVYVSSIKVNGEQTQDEPFTESYEARPLDPYAISKWEAEQALWEISRETGMEVVIIRPPLVYGPSVKANFYNLLKLVSKALPLPLGSIQNHRSMIYVDNLVDILILAASHPQAADQTYLVSDGQDLSTPQLVKEIADAMECSSRVFPFPVSWMRLGAKLLGKSSAIDRLTQSLVIDSSKIRKDLGWRPPYTITQGLQATAEWYRQLTRSERD